MGTTSQQSGVRRTSVTLRPRGVSPRLARRLVRELASGSSLPTHVVDDAAFIVGELVTSSIREVHRTAVVTVELDDSYITVRVHDDGGDPLVSARSGGAMRRWEVVRRLATSWGYARDGEQRELWATIRTGQNLVAA